MDKSHLHNHFALNSVSFRDGGKYNSCKAATQRLRDVSDGLCREYGLSIIENPGKSPPRMIYLAEKRGEPTNYNIFRQAIDRAVAGAVTKKQFEDILRLQGFEIKMTGKHWSIKIIGDKRATRLFRLGERYTGEAITKRIYESDLNKKRILYNKPKPIVGNGKFKGSIHQAKKLKGYRALYFYFLYRMGVLPKRKKRPPCNPILWEDVRKIRKYSEQTRLIVCNKIDTVEQLQSFMVDAKSHMDELIRQRTHIQNKLRRAKEPEVIEALKVEKTELTAHITPLRRNLRIANEIEERTARMKEKLAIIKQLELQEIQNQKVNQRKYMR